MLYNQDWEQPKKDMWSLDTLIEWIKTKSGHYYYPSCGNCLLAQYFTEMTGFKAWVGHKKVSFDLQSLETMKDLPNGWAEIAGLDEWNATSNGNQTFEAALERAIKFKAEQMVVV